MNKKIKTEAVDHLFQAILTLKNPEECYIFFEDVCTVNELLSLSQRYEVAKMLREKKTYLEIAEKTGASTATISPVSYTHLAHDPFESTEAAIEKGSDIHSETIVVKRVEKRKLVGDTDVGMTLKENIADLEKLLEAYRTGALAERIRKK